MTRILLPLLTVAAVVVVACQPSTGPVHTPSPLNPVASTATTKVVVTFDGLMVFAKVGDHYEVGVLDDQTALNHEFKISVGENEKDPKDFEKYISYDKAWTLDVITSGGNALPANVTTMASKPCDRLKDSQSGDNDLQHVFDFCWIMDMENDFLAKPLQLKPKRLKPVIFLNAGQLYSRYKYDELDHEKSLGTFINYGMVTETVGLEVELKAGERLVLRAEGNQIFSLGGANEPTNAGIFNAPKPKYQPVMRASGANTGTHFLYYYNLFCNVDAVERYDVRPTPNGHRPLNRYVPPQPLPSDPQKLESFLSDYVKATRQKDDEIRMRTVDEMSCGGLLLGRRTKSLLAADVTDASACPTP